MIKYITPAQFRAARAMLKIKVSEISKTLKMGNSTINRIENYPINDLKGIQFHTLAKLIKYYEDSGIVFTKNAVYLNTQNQELIDN